MLIIILIINISIKNQLFRLNLKYFYFWMRNLKEFKLSEFLTRIFVFYFKKLLKKVNYKIFVI